MAEFPAIPFWVDAFVHKTCHLNDAEAGLYLRLLMLMWTTPKCRVPDDNVWLAHKLKRSQQHIETDLRPLIAEFCEIHRNWIYQKRLLREWNWCKSKSVQNANSAKSRWNNEKDVCERNAGAVCERNAPTPTPKPIVKKLSNRHSGNGVKIVKKGQPRHGAISRDRCFIYLKRGTEEFDIYAKNFEDVKGAPPFAPEHGRWFRYSGEVNFR